MTAGRQGAPSRFAGSAPVTLFKQLVWNGWAFRKNFTGEFCSVGLLGHKRHVM